MGSQDSLDKTISFLQKREGIDKTLKILRYAARFITSVSPPSSDLAQRLDNLQSSLGVSRKAYRLGKFLQNVNALRQLKATSSSQLAYLELLGHCGEGMYYFIEQFSWLCKAGVLPKPLEKKFSYASAWCELVGYMANISLNLHKIKLLLKRQEELRGQLQKQEKDGEGARVISSLSSQLAAIRTQRMLRCAFVVQDCCDSLLALSDIRDKKDLLAHPSVLALGGLVSAFVSTFKYWNA